MSGWWWYPFVEHTFSKQYRTMGCPRRAELTELHKMVAELAEELADRVNDDEADTIAKTISICAVWRFLHSRDNEGDDAWVGVKNMWRLFFSQEKVWITAGVEEYNYRRKFKHDTLGETVSPSGGFP